MGLAQLATLHSENYSTQQHAEMDEEFKQYLEDKGLKLIRDLKTAVSAIVGILSECQCKKGWRMGYSGWFVSAQYYGPCSFS